LRAVILGGMADDYGDNVWAELPELGEGIRGSRLVREEGSPLAGAVWELPPGSRGVDYHFHHGTEEYLVVLRGTATLRTPDGERELPEGAVAHFSPGPEGAHTVMNLSDAPVRYLLVAAHASPDIIEYPDKGEFVAGAKSLSQRGEPFFVRLPMPTDG
jgi:uncharacterized cupin superfamily protein